MYPRPVKPDLLSLQQAADELGIAVTTLRHHCQRGNIPALKLGRDWVITREAVEWFREHKRPPGRPPNP